MGIMRWMFRTKVVRDVLFALDSLDQTALKSNPTYDDLKLRARRAIIQNPTGVRNASVVEGKQCLEIVLNLLVNLCGGDLASGREHTYRDTLSHIGRQKRALFFALQDMMLERRFISADDHEFAGTTLNQQIREAG